VPAAALAIREVPGDGTLVVKNGSAPRGSAVVTLVIRGAVIGQITAQGTVVIDDPTPLDGFAPEVTGYSGSKQTGDTTTRYSGINFRFRAVGGSYKITIYGSGVDLVASGHGNVILTGSPDDSLAPDGRYSLNGGDFRSLPAVATKQLTIGIPTSATG